MNLGNKRVLIFLTVLFLLFHSYGVPAFQTETTLNHSPILIDGNHNFTSQNGVTGGSGSIDNPYRIENWSITTDGIAHYGVEIRNTTAFFIIQNCTITLFYHPDDYTYAGIKYFNVENGEIRFCSCSQNSDGMNILNSTNITIKNCSFSENQNKGVNIKNSQQVQTSHCLITNNKDDGLYITDESIGIQIMYCFIDRNMDSGIRISECTEIQVYHTLLSNNSWMGIWAYNPTVQMMRFIIDNCTVSDNSIAGIDLESYKGHPSYSKITNCMIQYNGIGHGGHGLRLRGLSHNLIDNCTFHHNEVIGLVIASSNNIISNCSMYGQLSTPVLGMGVSFEGRGPPFIGRGLYSGKDNILKYCTIYDNMIGVSLAFIRRTVIHHCIVTQNHLKGFSTVFTCYAKIDQNNIVGNGFPYPTVNGSGVRPWWSFLDMRENWWGATDGPIYRNNEGHGDTIAGCWLSYIIFRPWLTEPVPYAGRQT